MKLKMLGTGHALVTECYNTCFVVCDNDRYFLVDGGGGSEILHRLKLADINVNDIHEMFVTHKHIDHIMGMIWLIRVICTGMKKGTYKGDANIYAHEEVISLLDDMAHKLLQPKETAFIGDRLHLVTSLITSAKENMRKTANGCFMKHFVFIRRLMFFRPMKSIIPR